MNTAPEPGETRHSLERQLAGYLRALQESSPVERRAVEVEIRAIEQKLAALAPDENMEDADYAD